MTGEIVPAQSGRGPDSAAPQRPIAAPSEGPQRPIAAPSEGPQRPIAAPSERPQCRAAAPRERMQRLFAELQPQLQRILVCNVQAPAWLIDEACQTAWGSLLLHAAAVEPGGELGWLSTTATREALRLIRRERLADTREEPPQPVCLAERRLTAPGPEEGLELRERLAEIRRLPRRQQRVVMLLGLGYGYGEIAAVTGDTRRTVARQLTRARQRLAQMADGT